LQLKGQRIEKEWACENRDLGRVSSRSPFPAAKSVTGAFTEFEIKEVPASKRAFGSLSHEASEEQTCSKVGLLRGFFLAV
jgi:hypothetical protein